MNVIMDSITGGSGRRIPDGGIIPARSLRTTFSQTSAWSLHMGDVELIEHQSAGFQALIVAGDAVLVEQGAFGGGRTGQRDRRGRQAGASCCERAVWGPSDMTTTSRAKLKRWDAQENCWLARGRTSPQSPLLIWQPKVVPSARLRLASPTLSNASQYLRRTQAPWHIRIEFFWAITRTRSASKRTAPAPKYSSRPESSAPPLRRPWLELIIR